MEPSSDPELRALLVVVVAALAGVVIAIVLLVRSGRSVRFPDLGETPHAGDRSRRDHVTIR